MQAPKAKKIPKELVTHGHKRTDNYFWMNKRDAPEVLDHLKAENAYCKGQLKDTENLQETLFQEITGRIKKDDNSVPYLLNGYFYYVKYEGDAEHPVYCRKKESLDNPEEIILNANERAKDHAYYKAAGLSVSPNSKMLAFGEDTKSRRIYTIKFLDLETGKILKDELPNTTSYAVWANDNKTLFYTVKDEKTLRPCKIYKHILGTPQSRDELIFEETDDTFNTVVSKLKSQQYIVIHSGSTVSDEYRVLDANSPEDGFRVFQERVAHLEYSIDHIDDRFYVLTNLDAKNFKLMRCGLNQTASENWEEVIAHRENVLLEDFDLFKNHLVLDERKNGLTQLRIFDLNAKKDHYLPFEEETYMAYLSINYEFDSPLLRYGYTSLTTPNSIYDYNMDTGEKILKKQQEVVGGYNPEDYESERIWAESHDGTKIPVSVVYKKGFRKNGKQPLLLYGYGSYGHTIDPYFSSTRLSLLDRGFAFAIAHIRGGEYLGRNWYETGKMLQKKNTFLDFIAAGEKLVSERFTGYDHLYAMGGSAGGLLIGAVINLKPEMWKGVIAAVPFVDVVTTMLDDSIPLTTGEYNEWGNPNEKEYYEYILSYSPYDNVEAKDYPHLFVTTGYHDSQVQYWEPAKWVAKLRELKTDDNLLLFHTNLEFGHSGAAGRFEMYREVAMEYAFLLKLEGQV